MIEEIKLSKFFNLKEIRNHFGFTQKQFAAVLHIKPLTYQRYEEGLVMMPDVCFELLKYKVFELNFCLTKLHRKAHADTFKP